jgi:ArsR family transcriptional regulator
MSDIRNEFYQLHASVCRGFADPKRLQIINALRDDELSVGEICEAVDLAQANASQHLAILRNKGQRVYYRITSPKINQALDLLLDVMNDQARMPTA